VQTIDTQRKFDFSSYFSLRTTTTLLAIAIIIGIALLSKHDHYTALLLLLVGAAKSIESLSDVFHGLFQRVERMDYSAKSLALNGVISILSVTLALYFTHSLLAAAAALASTWLLLLVLFDLPHGLSILAAEAESKISQRGAASKLLRSVQSQIRSTATFRLALLAFPLGIGTFLCALNINIPRYLIVMYIGERELGYFSALASSTIAIDLFVRALGTSAMPTLAKLLNSGDSDKFIRHVFRATIIAFTIGAIAVGITALWGKQLLAIIYRDDYASYSNLLAALMAVGAFSAIATTLSLATTAAHLFRQQALVYGINALYLLGSCWLLIPRYGLWGAVIGLGTAAILRILFYILLIHSVMQRQSASLPSN